MLRKQHWFALIALLIPLLFITVVILSNRQQAIDPLDPPGFAPTPAPSDWMTPGNGIDADKAPDPVDKRLVPAHRIVLSRTQTQDFLEPTSDGGCLAVTFDRVDESDTGSQPDFLLHVTRFKPDGRILWDRRYETDPFPGYGVSLCMFPDDSFAVAIRAAYQINTEMRFMDQLVRFRPDGTLDGKTEPEAVPAGGLDRIFARQDGLVLSAGTVDGTGIDSIGSVPRVTAFLIAKDGTVIERYMMSGVGFQTMTDAVYYEDTGLILLTSEERSVDGSAGGSWQRNNRITCLTDGLVERWNNTFDTKRVAYNILTEIKGSGLLISGAQRPDGQTSTQAQPVLIAIDREGHEKWTYTDTASAWVTGAASLTDGRLIVGLFSQGSGLNRETTLYVFPADNSAPTKLAAIQGHLMQLIPTRDGGFTAVLRQTVRQLPQPPFISSIWQDTAAVVAHYDSAFHLAWRRTIDQYKHDLRVDLIVATTDDRLLAG